MARYRSGRWWSSAVGRAPGAWLILVALVALSCGTGAAQVSAAAVTALAAPATPTTPAVYASAQLLAQRAAALRAEVRGSPLLTPRQKARDGQELTALEGRLPGIAAAERQIATQTALLQTLEEQRIAAQMGLDRLQRGVRANLRALTDALDLSTAAVSTTAQTVGVTATVAITGVRIDLQAQTAALVLNVQTSAQVLRLLALNTRTRLDTRRLVSRLNVLASGIQLGLAAVLRDLRLAASSDPAAASDAQSGLASGLAGALVSLNDSLLGTLDARLSLLRLGIARTQAQLTGLLNAAATNLGAVQSDVLRGEIAVAPLSASQRRQVQTQLAPVADDLRKAATASAQLASRLADAGALQDAQARIDREVQKAQADLDSTLVQADAALQGRLRSDVTVAISSTEQTIHVHLDSLDAGALARDLDFNVTMGLAVLQIAALHAEVTPSTQAFTGTPGTTIQGVDMVLQARLQGLQAHIRTDVAAVRAEQEQLSAAVRARVATLRSTLSTVLAPLIARYQADITRLQGELNGDLAAADAALRGARGALDALAHIQPLQGHVASSSMVALRRAPRGRSAVVYWIGRDSWLPLVGYVQGDAVRNPRTGRVDTRWYVLRDFYHSRGYLYVSGAQLEVSPRPG